MFLTQEEEKSGTATPESTGVDATPDTDKKEETYQVNYLWSLISLLQ